MKDLCFWALADLAIIDKNYKLVYKLKTSFFNLILSYITRTIFIPRNIVCQQRLALKILFKNIDFV